MSPPEAAPPRRVPRGVWLLTLVAWLLLTLAAVWAHRCGRTSYLDLGYQYNAAWNSAQGESTRLSFHDYGGRRFIHFSPLGYAASQLLRLHDSAETLLAVQAGALALCLPLCFLLGREVLGDEGGGWLLAGVCLLTPSLVYWNQFDYHPVVFAAPTLLAGCYALIRGSTPGVVVAFGLALLVREDVPLTVGWIGFVVALAWPSRRRLGVGIAVAGALCFYLANAVVIPSIAGDAHHPQWKARFGHLGSSPREIVVAAVTSPLQTFKKCFSWSQAAHLGFFVAPTLGIPLLAPEVLAAGLPYLGYSFLIRDKNVLNVRYHYCAVFVPLVLVAFAVGLRRLEARLQGRGGERPRARPWVVRAVLASSLFWWLLLHSWLPAKPDMFTPRPFVPHLDAIRELVPTDAPLWVQESLFPHLCNRAWVTAYPRPDPEIEVFPWVVLSLHERGWPPFWMPWRRGPVPLGEPEATLDALEANDLGARYAVAFQRDGVVVLRHDPERLHPETLPRLRRLRAEGGAGFEVQAAAGSSSPGGLDVSATGSSPASK